MSDEKGQPAAARRNSIPVTKSGDCSRHAIDYHVGQRIRALRQQLGITQTGLGRRVGVSFQQIQKYEWGANRVSASTLYEIAVALSTAVASFFDGL